MHCSTESWQPLHNLVFCSRKNKQHPTLQVKTLSNSCFPRKLCSQGFETQRHCKDTPREKLQSRRLWIYCFRPAAAPWEQWGHLRQQKRPVQDWEGQGEEAGVINRIYLVECCYWQQQWGLETEPKVPMGSHRDDWCWRLAAREGTSPHPRAAGAAGSSTAREDQPSDLSPAEGLQPPSWRNKQRGTPESGKFLDTERWDGLGWTLHRKVITRPGLIQLRGFALTHRGEGAEQQPGPRWAQGCVVGSAHPAQPSRSRSRSRRASTTLSLSCQAPLPEAILGAGTKESILLPPK